MEFLSNGFGLLATILGAVGLLGGAAGYFKASRGDSIIKYQTLEIDALRRKVGDLEKEKIELESDVKAVEAKCAAKDEIVADQAKQIKFLQKMGQGSPQLKKLTAAITNQTDLLTKWMDKETKKDAA